GCVVELRYVEVVGRRGATRRHRGAVGVSQGDVNDGTDRQPEVVGRPAGRVVGCRQRGGATVEGVGVAGHRGKRVVRQLQGDEPGRRDQRLVVAGDGVAA